MNGHLQLSISLKDPVEIQNAIDLLKNLLPEEPSKMDIIDVVKMSMINQENKMTPEFSKYHKGKIKPKKRKKKIDIPDAIKTVRMIDMPYKEKQRIHALERKRDKYGHFLKDAKKK